MTEDKGILIRNIYWMLAYAFQVLRQNNYENILADDFKETENLFAAILSKGISQLLKQGLNKEFVDKKESLSGLKGKLDINGTLRERVRQSGLLSCEYDELTEDNIYNRILRTTAERLIRCQGVDKKWKDSLRRSIMLFSGVSSRDEKSIRWNTLTFKRGNETYRMLINICYVLLTQLLKSTDVGDIRMKAFDDEQMHKVFEKFVLNYYRKEYSGRLSAASNAINWDYDDPDAPGVMFMPGMKSDIMLSDGSRTLIIDTKYYGKIMQSQWEKESFRSNNLYQIFTYVKNYDKGHNGNVSGMLLYAQTAEEQEKDFEASVGGNVIYVRTLNLNQEFKGIRRQLDSIVKMVFNI